MRIESAFYSSKHGIDAHGKAIAVIGDNISNSNTVGYKASRTEFSDLMSNGEASSDSPAMADTGSGVQISRVRPIQETGVIEFSGRALDAAVAGQGFFLVGDATAPQLTKAGNFEISPEGLLVDSSGNTVLGFTGVDGATLGAIDMVNIDLTGEPSTEASVVGNLSSQSAIGELPEANSTFKEIGQAAAYSSTISVFDSLGAEHSVSLFYFKTAANTWTVQAYADGADVGGEAGAAVNVGTATLAFDENGVILPENAGDAVLTIDAEWTGAAQANVPVDLSAMTQFASQSQITNVTRDGQSSGAIQGYELESNGGVIALLNTGARVQVGTLQLGTVQNVDGLDRVGSNSFRITNTSGELITGSPGVNGFGTIEAASLERSTVDLSKEFVDLVLFQRGYQANSQLLNAANDILRDTIALIR